MSRVCCCSVSHADAISPITTIQFGEDAITWARSIYYHHDTASMLEQVVGECDGE